MAKALKIGERYNFGLTNLNGLRSLPSLSSTPRSMLSTLSSENRDDIQIKLKENDIPSISYYSSPLHLQLYSTTSVITRAFPVARKVANQCLSLPMSPYLSVEDETKIQETISLL